MPKVKKKTARRSATKGTRRKAPARKTRAKRKQPTMIDLVRDFWARFSRAAIAAFAVIAFIAVLLLWSGGYFGLLGERVDRMAGAGIVSAGFEIKRITVMGQDQTDEQDLLSAVGPVIGTSLLHFDPYAARARVEEIGWVRSAAISRLWPGAVHISIREREPAAVWQLSGALHLIDQNGALIREIGAYEYSNLPLIVGAGAPGAASDVLKALRDQPELWGRTAALIRVGDRRWNLRTKNSIDVKFPEENIADAVEYLARLQTKLALLDRPLEYIDLRNPENFVYREKGESEETIADDKAPG